MMEQKVSDGSGLKVAVVCAAVILLSAVALTFSYLGYPPAGNNDASWFMVPGIQFSLTGELENNISWLDPKLVVGNGPFLAYPPLFPLFLGQSIFSGINIPLPVQAFFAVAIINIAVIVLSAWTLYAVATTHGKRLSWQAVALICAALFMILRSSWSFGGRPEVLIRLLFTVGLFLFLTRQNWRYFIPVIGILFGLSAATHVIAPVVLFAFMGVAFAIKYDFWNGFKKLARVTVIGIATFFVVMQLSPFGIFETIFGAYHHGTLMASRINPLGALLRFTENPVAILFAVVTILLVVAGFRLFSGPFKKDKIASPYSLLFFLALAAAYFVFALINSRNYYMSPFFLLLFAALVYHIVHINGSDRVRYPIVFLFAVLMVFSFKYPAMFPAFLNDGLSLREARAEFGKVLSDNPGLPVVLGGSHIWALSEDYGRMLVGDPRSVGTSEYLLIKEEWEFPKLPQELNGCTLKHDFYTHKAPKVFGIAVNDITPGYGFAAYECGGLN